MNVYRGTQRRRWLVRAVAVAVVAALAGNALAGNAMAGPATADPGAGQRLILGSKELLAAVQRDLGLTPAQASSLLAAQTPMAALNERLIAALDDEFGGSWVDQKTGKLTVALTNAGRADQVRAMGARVVVVKHSKRSLEAITTRLDALVKQDKAKLAGVTTWAVDEQRNQVVVTVHPGQSSTLKALVAGDGDAVRVEESDLDPVPAADFLDGGDRFNSCSVGFNVTRGGVGHFLTAGHCGPAGTATYANGVYIGPVVESWFPTYDDALVRNDNPGYWFQGPWVFAYNGNPNAVYNINGYRNSPINTPVCKSGYKTGLTCGRITIKNKTVNYPQGTVYGLTEHTACVEPGDSGGANFSQNSAGNFAEGMTSGAALINDRCRQVYGQQNVSWFYPIAASIAYYGVTLMTA